MTIQTAMNVSVAQNQKRRHGFQVRFPYDPQGVIYIKNILGVAWNGKDKSWDSEGPEVLLDMHRFGINIGAISDQARASAEAFREEIWNAMDARVLDIEEHEYGYQIQGARYLASMSTAILGDDMGTGKTKQSLDAAEIIGAQFMLVICPKTLTYNWIAEVLKWHPEWTAGVVPDVPKSRKKRDGTYVLGRDDFWENPPNVVIVNYEKLRMADWPYDLDWDVVIPDEATRLKTSTTQVYKNVKRIAKRSGRVWLLTGTPLEIRVTELYNLLSLIRPAVLGGYYRFRDQHCLTDWAGAITGVTHLELLRERIAPFILRRTKAEVLRQLPSKVSQNIYVKFTDAEQEAYNAFTSAFNNWLNQHGVSGAGNPLTEMLRMEQFCCSPDLFTDELGRGSKFEALEEIINLWEGRILVFCYYEEMTARLQRWLGSHPEAYISGPISDAAERLRRVDAFNRGELGKVFISTDAGNQGLNFTKTNLIVHYNQLFNPQKMVQREDRLHRIGQEDNVTVMNLMMLDSIDLGKYQLGLEGKELFREVVDGAEEALLRKLDAPRLRRLVEGRLNDLS